MTQNVKDIIQPPKLSNRYSVSSRGNNMSMVGSPTPEYEDTGFKYEFIGRGQDTIVSSDIKKYPLYSVEKSINH